MPPSIPVYIAKVDEEIRTAANHLGIEFTPPHTWVFGKQIVRALPLDGDAQIRFFLFTQSDELNPTGSLTGLINLNAAHVVAGVLAEYLVTGFVSAAMEQKPSDFEE